jgi:hypothetical protein
MTKQNQPITKKSTKKKAVKSAVVTPVKARPPNNQPGRFKLGTYYSLLSRPRIKHPVRLSAVWQLSKTAALTLWQYRGLFIGITVVYGLLNLILVHGFANGTDVGSLKTQLSKIFSGNYGSLVSSLTIFVVLIGSAGNGSSSTAGAYQALLVIVASLAIIWALRQVLTGTRPRIRDAYYRGMSPLVPFILVLLVIGLQLLPLLVGSTLYSLVISNGIAVHFVEKLFWAVLFVGLALLSLYMISSSIFALYIVTLPDMTPLKALRSARQLVRYRRWTVLRKLLFLPILLVVAAAIVMLPIIVWLTPLAPWVFFGLTMLAIAAVHTYTYTLYRELLNE